VIENTVLRKIFGPKREAVEGQWSRRHNEELCDLYSSPNITGVIKRRRMRLAGRLARIGERICLHRLLVGRPDGKVHFEDLGIDGRIILKLTLKK
jgi:hypothetical protein